MNNRTRTELVRLVTAAESLRRMYAPEAALLLARETHNGPGLVALVCDPITGFYWTACPPDDPSPRLDRPFVLATRMSHRCACDGSAPDCPRLYPSRGLMAEVERAINNRLWAVEERLARLCKETCHA